MKNPFSSLLLDVVDNDKEKLDKLQSIILREKLKFDKKGPCVICWTVVGGILGGFLVFLSLFIYSESNSFYTRKGLDEMMKKYVGYTTWDKLLVKDLFTPSFEWNS